MTGDAIAARNSVWLSAPSKRGARRDGFGRTAYEGTLRTHYLYAPLVRLDAGAAARNTGWMNRASYGFESASVSGLWT